MLEGIEEEELAQPLAALGLGDGQPRQKKTRQGVLWQPFEQFRRVRMNSKWLGANV